MRVSLPVASDSVLGATYALLIGFGVMLLSDVLPGEQPPRDRLFA